MLENCNKYYKESFSQMGEDIIINHFLTYVLEIEKPYYLDIGANHPWQLSNTAFFYKNCGSKGVLVEPNPALYEKIKNDRKRDTVLNVGIGVNESESIPFYIMSYDTLSTFDYSSVEMMERKNFAELVQTIEIPLVPVMAIIEKYCEQAPNIVSLDVEGIDFDILKTFDFEKIKPEVFIIETAELGKFEKNQEIIDYMKSKGYLVIADTFINTIFMDESKIKKHFDRVAEL